MSLPFDGAAGEPRDARTASGSESAALTLLAALVQHRRLLWRYPLIIAVAVAGLSFLFPNVYRSTVTVLPA